MDPTPWPKNKNGSVSTAIEEKRDYQKTKLKLQSKTLTYITTPTIIIHRSLLHSQQYRSTKTQQNPNQSVDYNPHRYSKSTDVEGIALNRLALPLSELDGHEKNLWEGDEKKEAQFSKMLRAQKPHEQETHMKWPKPRNDCERSTKMIQT